MFEINAIIHAKSDEQQIIYLAKKIFHLYPPLINMHVCLCKNISTTVRKVVLNLDRGLYLVYLNDIFYNPNDNAINYGYISFQEIYNMLIDNEWLLNEIKRS